MENLLIVLIWAVIAYVVADKMGRSRKLGFGWSYALTLLFGIFGVAAVYFWPKKEDEVENNNTDK